MFGLVNNYIYVVKCSGSRKLLKKLHTSYTTLT
jgi:hypothetical protein